MPQEIVSQSDYYGLPQPERAPAPAPEHVAELLKAPQPWSGPTKIAAEKCPYCDDTIKHQPGLCPEYKSSYRPHGELSPGAKFDEGTYYKEAPHLDSARQQRQQVENRKNR